MKTLTFFNNKGGVGKTSLVYHLAWMFAERGVDTLALDLDPQANLTSMFLNNTQLETLWPDDAEHADTVFGAVRPILRGTGDIALPQPQVIRERLGLIAGDLGLSLFEDKLSDAWPRCGEGDEAAFRATTAFHRLVAEQHDTADKVVLIDIGPNLGAINRAALIASDYIVMPLAADLFSLQGLKNLGPTVRAWRKSWRDEKREKAPQALSIPQGNMQPMGYVVMQHGVRVNRAVKAYQRWIKRIPSAYREHVLNASSDPIPQIEDDPHNLAQLKHYHSLMPLAMEARKPMFHLRVADGAIGSHQEAVQTCHDDFRQLARQIAARCEIDLH